MVEDPGLGHVQELLLRPALSKPNAEFGVITAAPVIHFVRIADPKAAESIEQLAAKGHVAPDQVAYLLCNLRHAEIRATDDPVELRREPARSAAHPHGHDRPADAGDLRPFVVLDPQS